MKNRSSNTPSSAENAANKPPVNDDLSTDPSAILPADCVSKENPNGKGPSVRKTGNKKNPNKRSTATWMFLGAYAMFVGISFMVDFETGKEIGTSLFDFLKEMVFIIPGAFILIGLFEVWVPRSMIEKHLGDESSLLSHLWVFLLAGTTVGGLYLAFPVAYAIRSKGAKLSVIFSYVGFSGVCRIPMTLFEISFMGAQFTLIRYVVAIPIIILSSEILGSILERKGFSISEPGD